MHEIAAITGHARAKCSGTRRRLTKRVLREQQWIRPNSEHPLSNFQSGLTIWPKKIAKSKCELKGGGPGRTGTSNQTVMSGGPIFVCHVLSAFPSKSTPSEALQNDPIWGETGAVP